MTLPRPPKGVAPAAFYCDYVSTLWAALGAGALPQVLETEVRVGDERFTLRTGPEGVSGLVGAATAPLFTFECRRDDFLASARDLLPRVLRQLDKELERLRARLAAVVRGPVAAIDLAAVRRRPGRIEIAYTDDAGDVMRCALLVAAGTGPRALVHVSEADLFGFLASGGRLSKLLGTKLRVEGDVTYVIQVAAALGS